MNESINCGFAFRDQLKILLNQMQVGMNYYVIIKLIQFQRVTRQLNHPAVKSSVKLKINGELPNTCQSVPHTKLLRTQM